MSELILRKDIYAYINTLLTDNRSSIGLPSYTLTELNSFYSVSKLVIEYVSNRTEYIQTAVNIIDIFYNFRQIWKLELAYRKEPTSQLFIRYIVGVLILSYKYSSDYLLDEIINVDLVQTGDYVIDWLDRKTLHKIVVNSSTIQIQDQRPISINFENMSIIYHSLLRYMSKI